MHLWTMRLAPHRPACRGQRCALPTAPAFAHNLHSASYYIGKTKRNIQGAEVAEGRRGKPKARHSERSDESRFIDTLRFLAGGSE
jgi:hypothetical protein